MLPRFGRVSAVHPANAHIKRIDEDWPPKRRETDWHHAWRWKDLTATRPECFAVVTAEDELLGIWCSAKAAPISLPEGRFYRPDFLEVSPDARGGDIGAFLFLVITARALELGARGIVLGTWPMHRAFYALLGGVERRPRRLELGTQPGTVCI
jgi:GNAT superfamily N-acetyltransferase